VSITMAHTPQRGYLLTLTLILPCQYHHGLHTAARLSFDLDLRR
jgi:hypothetical protein